MNIFNEYKYHYIGRRHEPSFQNSWVNYGSGYNSASFYKTKKGFVHLKGLVKSGTISNSSSGTIFTLPNGYRPHRSELFAIASHDALGRVNVIFDGQVEAAMGDSGWFSLDNVYFYAADPEANPWHYVGEYGEPSFQGNFSNYGYQWCHASFYKDEDGVVYLRGLIKSSDSAPTNVFYLPPGYRPLHTNIFVVVAHDGSNYVISRIDVYSNGQVRLISGSASNFLSISGISFFTQ